MELTGLAMIKFEKWYYNISYKRFSSNHLELIQSTPLNRLGVFRCMPVSMQYGVYVDFFDSVGIYIKTKRLQALGQWMYILERQDAFHLNDYLKNRKCFSRHEARKAAIDKANEIFNNQNK